MGKDVIYFTAAPGYLYEYLLMIYPVAVAPSLGRYYYLKPGGEIAFLRNKPDETALFYPFRKPIYYLYQSIELYFQGIVHRSINFVL